MAKGQETTVRPPAPAAQELKGVGWGIDDHRTIIELIVAGILAVVVGVLISGYTTSSNPAVAELGLLVGPAVGGLILVVAAALFWSSRLGKVREMDEVLANIPFGGDEVVLDIGCGRGLGMVKVAGKLRSGISVGIDTWQKSHLSGTSPKAALANASALKVSGRVSAVKGVSTQLPIVSGTIDVIVSGVAIHRVPRKDRHSLFSEMKRVLKEGGRVGILDAGNGNEYSNLLKENGFADISAHRLRFSGFPPFHIVMARKPYG